MLHLFKLKSLINIPSYLCCPILHSDNTTRHPQKTKLKLFWCWLLEKRKVQWVLVLIWDRMVTNCLI